MTSAEIFHSAREAKEFLISKIVEQAQCDGVSLSDLERTMLYFSETGWTLPSIGSISEEFDRVCDQDEYEEKIVALIKGAYKEILRDPGNGYEKWWSAIRLLRKQDHYILVMVNQAGLRSRHDQLKLLAAGIGIVAVILCAQLVAFFLREKYGADLSRDWPSGEKLGFTAWIVALGLAVLTSSFYYVSRLIKKRK